MATLAPERALEWIGITTDANRLVVIADLLPAPEGFGNLKDETEDGITSACSNYTKRTPAATRFIVSRVAMKRLVALVAWVKDKARLAEAIEFPATITREGFLQEIEDAAERDRCRKNQKKTGESLINNDFTVKLKNKTQWERWSMDLATNLRAIIGAKGIPLLYVIRPVDAPTAIGHANWEEKAINMAPLMGTDYRQDIATVHQIIVRNIAEDSDAYTYIKPKLRMEDGRKDYKALIERYENEAAQQERIHEANRTLENLIYRNERSMSFEVFSAKLQRSLDALNECGRAQHNGDIVDKLWGRIQNPELQPFVQALKVQYTRTQRDYKDILIDIASQVPTLSKTPFNPRQRNVSEIGTSGKQTRDGKCPDTGAHTPDGKLFIGTYPANKWHHESVKPYQEAIRSARGSDGKSHPSRKQKKYTHTQAKKDKKRIAKLEVKIAQLSTSQEASSTSNDTTEGNATPSNQAGTAFGGRAAKKQKKDSE